MLAKHACTPGWAASLPASLSRPRCCAPSHETFFTRRGTPDVDALAAARAIESDYWRARALSSVAQALAQVTTA